MNQVLWEKAVGLLCECIDQPPERLEAVHESLLGSDPELAMIFAEMVAADKTTSIGGTLNLETLLLASSREDVTDEYIGTTMGVYNIESLLGQGGMGTVYLATHQDHKGLAAVKILPPDSPSERRIRFEEEKVRLGRLKHEHIASISHSGTHTDGTQFFGMEYVKGSRIHDYCEEKALTISERLRLMLQVCEAVQAAHTQTIVHRDLKPSNILVNAEGSVKLVDFGLAAETNSPTLFAVKFLSAPYACPEYTEALPSIASDVYSLGIVLFELISGRLPFETKGVSASQVRMQVLAGNLPRLSSLCHTDQLRRATKTQWKELDYISSKATAFLPEHRYITVNALAEDIGKFLSGLPLPLPDAPPLYGQLRFISRHRTQVVWTAAMAIVLIGLVAGYTLKLRLTVRQAVSAEKRAELAATHAERLESFSESLFDVGEYDQGPSKDLTANALLERSLPKVANMRDDPAAQAEFYLLLGAHFADLDSFDQAERMMQLSLKSRQRVSSADSLEVAKVLIELSKLRAGEGQPASALELAERAVRNESHLPADNKDRLDAEEEEGQVLASMHDELRAIPLLEDVVRRARLASFQSTLSNGLNDLGIAYDNAHRYQDALRCNQESLKLDRQLYGDRHPNIAAHLLTAGNIAFALKQYTEAYQNDQQAVEILTSWFGANHLETAAAKISAGEALAASGKAREALPMIQAGLHAEEVTYPFPSIHVAHGLMALALAQDEAGDSAGALRSDSEALRTYRALYPKNNSAVASALFNVAYVQFYRKQFAEAEKALREAVKLNQELLTPDDPQRLDATLMLGATLGHEHRNTEARTVLAPLCTAGAQPDSDGAKACEFLKSIEGRADGGRGASGFHVLANTSRRTHTAR